MLGDMKVWKKRNCRDLAYLVNAEGMRLREGIFFRSGKLYHLKKKALAFFESLKLKTIVDLRTPGEIDKKPDTEIEGAVSYTYPVLSAATLGITHEKGLKAYKEPPDMHVLYAGIIKNEDSSAMLGRALHQIMSLEDGPRLWHCTAGKDRAGILTSVFLLALGYKEEDIIKDYELSDKPNRRMGHLYRFLIFTFLWKPRVSQAVFRAMLADKGYLLSAWEAMKETCGSIRNYIRERLGVTDEEIATFKDKYMVKA